MAGRHRHVSHFSKLGSSNGPRGLRALRPGKAAPMLPAYGLDVAVGPPPGLETPVGAAASSIVLPPPGLAPPENAADHVWELLVVKMWDQINELRATQQMFKDHLRILDLQKVKDADRLDEDAERIVDLETLMHSLHARLGNLELCVERLRLKK